MHVTLMDDDVNLLTLKPRTLKHRQQLGCSQAWFGNLGCQHVPTYQRRVSSLHFL